MALKIDVTLTPSKLVPQINRLFELSAQKILSLQKAWDPAHGTPVFTVGGKYTTLGWTEWTQGFQFGSTLLQFDATGDEQFLQLGRKATVELMAAHVSHVGVHDHGFNNISTYGNLWRVADEGKTPVGNGEKQFLELALKISGAIQAARWTETSPGHGFIYSFNGPHSLFVDTIRSLRSLAVAHLLGHVLMGERDRRISLLERLLRHAEATARFSIYFGKGRDSYDISGRTAHESIFDINDGSYRCPNSQQGYSPFTTWTRGLAWAILGFAEQLEFLETLKASEPAFQLALADHDEPAGKSGWIKVFAHAAIATAEFYLGNTCTDGIPFWDTGAPGLSAMRGCLEKKSDPYNHFEPVDSSAAAIAAQGFLRLGKYLSGKNPRQASQFVQAGLTIAKTLFSDPYLSENPRHQGLVLHSIYHRPNGWDFVAPGQKVPNGESSMWGDYHARELALLILRQARREEYLKFFRV